ncbi:MAG: class I SAM-dependent methyltransferase [Bacillota bacterium]
MSEEVVPLGELQEAPGNIEASSEYEGLFAEFYDILHSSCTGDVSMYVDLVKEYGGPVLEMGCGTGRILFPLARAGFSAQGGRPFSRHAFDLWEQA